MVIAVQKGLENLKSNLRAKGYNVVTYGEYFYPIDALIYNDTGVSMLSMNAPAHNETGIFMINAGNKSIEDIDYALKNKVYSPLF